MPDSKKQPLSSDALTGIAIGIAGLGAAVLQLDWISRSLIILFVIALTIYAAQRHSAHPVSRITVAVLIVGLFVGFGWRPIWDDFHSKYPAVFAAWTSKLNVPPKRPPEPQEQALQPPPAKAEPPKPWVSDEEIEQQRRNKRALISYTPEEIAYISNYFGKDRTELYKNKWIKISHEYNGTLVLAGDKKENIVIDVRSGWPIHLVYNRKKWEDTIASFRSGHMINTICQIYDTDKANLYLYNCDGF